MGDRVGGWERRAGAGTSRRNLIISTTVGSHGIGHVPAADETDETSPSSGYRFIVAALRLQYAHGGSNLSISTAGFCSTCSRNSLSKVKRLRCPIPSEPTEVDVVRFLRRKGGGSSPLFFVGHCCFQFPCTGLAQIVPRLPRRWPRRALKRRIQLSLASVRRLGVGVGACNPWFLLSAEGFFEP